MKVKQLKINSFRGIRDLTLGFDLSEPTVFIGINGVGKSSILDCLAILLSWFNASIQNIRNEEIYFSDSDINNQSSRTQNKITVCTPHLEDFSWSLIKRNPDFLFPKGKQYVNNIKKLVLKIYDNYNNGILGSLPIAIYYPTQRAVLDIILETKQEDLFETFKAYDLALTPQKINFNSFFEWFRNREDLENENYRYNPKQGQDKQLKAVRQAIYQMLDGFSTLRVRVERFPLQMTLEKNGQKLIVI